MNVSGDIDRKYKLESITIVDLKGIKNCTIVFDKPLIALMGVNGIGKSTVIHALACCFKPKSLTESDGRRKFYEFFPPTPNKSWKDSNFILKLAYSYKDDDGNEITEYNEIKYSKDTDRWKPRYEKQPVMDVRFIGINTCCPEIESFKGTKADFSTSIRSDKHSSWIVNKASFILNKDYEYILNNALNKKNYLGVKTKGNITYSSLSMGAGEQRVFRILDQLHQANSNSLVLIDEIELLLHSDALRKLIFVMNEIANKRNLQIIFTTHSLIMGEFRELVGIRYLDRTSDQTIVYNGISSMAWNKLSGENKKPIIVYVEDELAESIVRAVAKELSVSGKVEIRRFGAIENAFTLASALIMKGENVDNQLIVTDGDRYTDNLEKENQIKRHLSGNEEDADDKRQRAGELITQLNLPAGIAPEEYLFNSIKNYDENNEIVECAKNINAVADKHDLIKKIIGDTCCTYQDIIELFKNNDNTSWMDYTKNVQKWLSSRKTI